MTLKKLDKEQIEVIAQIHQLAFPESAWTKLGQMVVEEYYLWHLLGPHPHVRATGVFIDDECAAYCVSGVFNGSTSGFLRNNRKLFATQIAKKPWLLLDPIFVSKLRSGLRILKRFSNKKSLNNKGSSPTREPSFGILAIAVHPRHQGSGLGKLLMDDAEGAAIDLDYKKMDLTVNPKNLNAVKFYERLNWRRYMENDIWKGIMVKDLRAKSNVTVEM